MFADDAVSCDACRDDIGPNLNGRSGGVLKKNGLEESKAKTEDLEAISDTDRMRMKNY